MPRPSRVFPILVPLVLAATAVRAADDVPLFDGVSGFGRTVTIASPEAQRYFDQAMAFYWGFHHEEVVRTLEHVLEMDPDCAMAMWGIALALGPNINNPVMEEDASKRAYAMSREALAKSGGCTDTEKDLIQALTTRYADPIPEDRADLDRAYSDAMRGVFQKHPGDADVACWFAESLMDLRPWDLWSADGEPRPETPEVIATLDAALAVNPNHPGGNHFYIHTLEASPEPERAEAAADRLRDLVPGAGHLVHMPSHIDIRLGKYHDALATNQRAVKADLAYLAAGGVSGFYTIYRAHNYHFITYAAMFCGQREVAMQAARELQEQMPMELVLQYADFLDAFVAVPLHVMVRFGMWEDILAEPPPPAELPVSTAFWHCHRTVAMAALGRVDDATAEFAELQEAVTKIPESALIGNNTALTIMDIGLPFAEGELEYRRGNYDRAFDLLRTAADRDVALHYDEPWGWMEPVRHALGALLLEQGHVEEAEGVYLADLKIHPGNGWALYGLAECQRRLGKKEEAKVTESKFREAWAGSDQKIKASCYCRTKT